VLSHEYHKLIDKDDRINALEILSILNEEFGVKIHDVNKVEFLNLMRKSFEYTHDD